MPITISKLNPMHNSNHNSSVRRQLRVNISHLTFSVCYNSMLVCPLWHSSSCELRSVHFDSCNLNIDSNVVVWFSLFFFKSVVLFCMYITSWMPIVKFHELLWLIPKSQKSLTNQPVYKHTCIYSVRKLLGIHHPSLIFSISFVLISMAFG